MTTTPDWDQLTAPGRSRGVLDLYFYRYLLYLLVRQELKVRYRGSVLGLLWSYVKPAVQFAVFYYALGEFLAMKANLPPFAVYLFAGIVVVNLFSETVGNATRSVLGNAPLVKKIYIPRELFPVASYIVALVHFVPQVVVLTIGAFVTGWDPGPVNLAAAIAGFAIVSCFALGLGLFFGAVNVAFRDVENIVDLVLMVAVWLSPVLYPWLRVQNSIGDGLGLLLYQLNPLTVGVELFHLAFWYPQAEGNVPAEEYVLPPHLWEHAGIALVVSLVMLAAGQLVFQRLSKRFAQEL